MNRTIFLKQNASHIAPELVLQGKRQSMEHLAAACEMTLPELVAHNAARIVSTLHLTDFQAYRKGTHFMLDLFSSKQTLSGIFESCAAEVLFELVVEWGNEDSRKDLVCVSRDITRLC